MHGARSVSKKDVTRIVKSCRPRYQVTQVAGLPKCSLKGTFPMYFF